MSSVPDLEPLETLMAWAIGLFVGDRVGSVTRFTAQPRPAGAAASTLWRSLRLNAPTGRADTPNEGGPSWVIAGPGLPG